MTQSLTLYTHADRSFYCTEAQAEVLDLVRTLNKGSIGAVQGYRPSSNWTQSPTVNLQIITRFSTAKLYERRLAALENIKFSDCADDIASDPILSKLPIATARDHFNDRMQMQKDSLTATLSGNREDSRRQGHDRCYVHVTDGVKVNLDCVKDKTTGLMEPVLHNGFPVVKSIMLMVLELNRKYITEGVRKVVKSGAPVLMGNIIEKKLNARSVRIKALSLKADNFESLKCSGEVLTPDDLKTVDKADEIRLLLEAVGFTFV